MKNSGLFIFLSLFLGTLQLTAQNDISHKYNEFDFWIGEWDVFKHQTDSLVGKSKIERIIDGKAIKETYHATTSKYYGTSLNTYNSIANQWEQFWVDNSGLTLHVKGNLEDGKMILKNEVNTLKGMLLNKIKWQKADNHTVRQTWYQSNDKGENWKVVFDGDYRLRKKQ